MTVSRLVGAVAAIVGLVALTFLALALLQVLVGGLPVDRLGLTFAGEEVLEGKVGVVFGRVDQGPAQNFVERAGDNALFAMLGLVKGEKQQCTDQTLHTDAGGLCSLGALTCLGRQIGLGEKQFIGAERHRQWRAQFM